MKYKRIERTLEETLKFFRDIHWCVGSIENDLILGDVTPKQYLTYYSYADMKVKAQRVIDFLFKKVEEFERGQWCWFWDDQDNFYRGSLAKYKEYFEGKHIDHYLNGHKHCISIKEFKKRLKKYL